MCGFDPFTVGMVATTAISAFGSIMQGNQSAGAGMATRNEAYAQAERDRVASSYEMTRTFEAGRRAQTAGIVQAAASGVTLAGSPTDALAEIAAQNELDIQAIRLNSVIRQQQTRRQGDLAYMTGQQRRSAGQIGALTAVAGGVSSYYNPARGVRMGHSELSGSVGAGVIY